MRRRTEHMPSCNQDFPGGSFVLSRWTGTTLCETVLMVIVETGEALLAETACSSSGVQDGKYIERHWTHRMVGRDWRLRGASCCVCTVAAASMRQKRTRRRPR